MPKFNGLAQLLIIFVQKFMRDIDVAPVNKYFKLPSEILKSALKLLAEWCNKCKLKCD